MILYRAGNLAELAGVPDFYIDGVGLVELRGANGSMILTREIIAGGGTMLIPKCEIIGPVAIVPTVMEYLQMLWRAQDGGDPIGISGMKGGRRH